MYKRILRLHERFRQKEQTPIYALIREVYSTNEHLRTSEIKIALVTQDAYTLPKSSAFIRLISPLTDPAVASKISFQLFDQNTINIGEGFDICIVQRAVILNLADAKKLAANLKKTQTPLIVDSDDSFAAIDATHPEYDILAPRVDALNHLLDSADQIWLSTDELAKSYIEYSDKIHVVQNCLDKRLWGKSTSSRNNKSTPIQFIYMGTATHEADFNMIFPALDSVAEKHPGSFELTVIGVTKNIPDRPWVKRVVQGSGPLYPNFVSWFTSLSGYDFGLAPLVDNAFNCAKSDIKPLDYLAAGIVPIVSNILPYKNTDLDDALIRVNNTQKSWEKTLTNIIINPDNSRKTAQEMVEAGQAYIWNKRNTTRTAQELLLLLEKVANKKITS